MNKKFTMTTRGGTLHKIIICCVLFLMVGNFFPVNLIASDIRTVSVTATLEMQMEQKISIEIKNSSLRDILYEIQKKASINIAILDGDIDKMPKRDFSVTNKKVSEVLDMLLGSTPYDYELSSTGVAINKRIVTQQRQPQDVIRFSGKVVDEKGTPLVGATVISTSSSSNGSVTDAEGKFAMTAKRGEQFEVAYIGMIGQVITVDDATTNLVITMVADALAVEDVIVTSYFNRSRESYTGNATTYTGDELRVVSSGNIMSTLSMIDPSFKMVVNNEMGSNPNYLPEFTIQGSTNLQNEYSSTPNMPTFIMDGFEVSAQTVFDFDPNRIQSITILKDAAATAIYGSKSDNGVVVIVTIPPKEGDVRFSYSFNGDVNVADLSSYNLMNAAEKLQYELLAGEFNANSDPSIQEGENIYNNRLKLVQSGINTEWLKLPINEAPISQKHSLMIDGGSKEFRYSIDLNYRDERGAIKESGRKTVGISSKIQYATEKLRFSNHMTFDNTKANNSPYGSFAEYAKINPYYTPYDANGDLNMLLYEAKDIGEVDVYNPMYNSTINTKDTESINSFTERFNIEWDVMEGLKLKGNAAIVYGFNSSDVFKPNGHTDFKPANVYDNESLDNIGSYNKGTTTSFSYDVNASASYFKVFEEKHVLNAVAVYKVSESVSDSHSYTAWNFPNDNFDHVSMSTTFKENDRPLGSESISRTMGVTLNANYNYDSRLLFDVSLTSDASSIFGSNKRWGTFYAVGAGWNIHNEKFLGDNSIVTMLKPRVSYGTTGGQNFSPYQAMKMLTYKNSSINDITYGDEVGALIMAYGNTDLKWQVTRKFNVGVDFAILDNRISGYFNYYDNLTKDKLIDFTLAPSTGYYSYKSNLGNVSNKGIELNLKGGIIRALSRDLRIDLVVNLVHNRNKLLNINDALTAYNAEQSADSSTKPKVKYMEGESLNMIWAQESLGIDPATGDEIFLDNNGERTNVYDVNNERPIASTDPNFEGNFGAIVSYKGFSLNANFQYSVGGYVYNTTLVNKIENVSPQFNGDARILYDRWQKAGDIAYYKNIADNSITYPTSRFIELENMLRFTSLNVSYLFNVEALKKYGIEKLRVTAIGNDIFTKSTVKMERGTEYPYARKFSLGVQITF